jgi:predicted GIY-YIG superfamily endonuclease
MQFNGYILQSEKSGRYYCGQTKTIADRLKRHISCRSKSTKAERPWKLGWSRKVT